MIVWPWPWPPSADQQLAATERPGVSSLPAPATGPQAPVASAGGGWNEALPAPLMFKSRRTSSPAGLAGGVAAPLTGSAAGEEQSMVPAAEPFRPFRAYVLAYPSRRAGHLHPVLSTLSYKRSDVREAFAAFYRDRDAANRQWARAMKGGARIVRLVVTMDPTFDLPEALQ